MEAYKIESGVPRVEGGRNKYPWRKLKVGQSFFVYLDGSGSIDLFALQRKLAACASGISKRGAGKFETRIRWSRARKWVGVRVWRTE